MSLFRTPERHAENPPESWLVVKAADRRWHLCTGDGPLDSFTTKTAATEAKRSGHLVKLYEDEGRWFAGETAPGMRSYAECKPEIDRAEAIDAARAGALG